MFTLIEFSPEGKTLIGVYDTYTQAENKSAELHNDYCDYIIYQLVG
jgi:hypothetical protein